MHHFIDKKPMPFYFSGILKDFQAKGFICQRKI
jgi:hypothetical protein